MSQRVPTWFGALLFLVTLAAPVASGAQTCWFTAAPDISFGNYDPTSPTPNDASGVFGFQCSNNGRTVEVSLDTGAGTYLQRQMTQGASRLAYNLCTDAACSTIFGDGTGGTATQSLSRLRDGVQIQIFGRIPVDQWVAAGLYSDTITITINY